VSVRAHQTPESEEYFFREGCYILELWNDDVDPELSIARARVEPGVSTTLHELHETTERYLVLSGSGIFRSGEQRIDLAPGKVVVIPADAPQSVFNNGSDDLVFLAFCTPRFRPENYRESDS